MKKRKLLGFAILLPFIIKCKSDVAPKEVPIFSVQKEMTVTAAPSFTISAAFTVQKQHFFIDPSRDTVLSIGNEGTQLHVPKNAFVDADGTLLSEKVTLSFQEYKNSAEMAFSKIPMTYKKGEEDLRFNSSGMFSIKGDCLGQAAFIAEDKALAIDYFLPKHNKDIDFYRLKNDSSNWELIAEIEELVVVEEKKEPIAQQVERNDRMAVEILDMGEVLPMKPLFLGEEEALRQRSYIYDASGLFLNQRPDADVKHLCDSLERIIRNGLQEGTGQLYGLLDGRLMNFFIKEKYIEIMPYVAMLPLSEDQIEVIAHRNDDVMRIKRDRVMPLFIPDDGDRKNATLLAEGINRGHTYPPIIKGLNIESFGVYNCDQIYRLPNPVNLLATYVDEKGNTINDAEVLSMIDLNYNGAFSFDPKQFTCSAKGDNVLALFTGSGGLYLLEKGAFEKMKITSSGDYTFVMTNMTKSIKNTADLAAYLDLEM